MCADYLYTLTCTFIRPYVHAFLNSHTPYYPIHSIHTATSTFVSSHIHTRLQPISTRVLTMTPYTRATPILPPRPPVHQASPSINTAGCRLLMKSLSGTLGYDQNTRPRHEASRFRLNHCLPRHHAGHLSILFPLP